LRTILNRILQPATARRKKDFDEPMQGGSWLRSR
jgi:hypothetical protein